MEVTTQNTAVAESSPAPAPETATPATSSTQVAENFDLASLSSSERMEWRKTGKLPTKPQGASATPAKPAKEASEAQPQEGEAESAAESAPAKDSQENRRPANKAEARIKELLADNKRLQAELAQRSQPTKAESSPAPPVPAKAEAPTKPKLEDFKTFEEYDAARDDYYQKLSKWEASEAVRQFQENQAKAQEQQRITEGFTKAQERYGAEFETSAKPVLEAFATDQGIHPYLKHILGKSQVMADLAYALGSDAAAREAFLREARSDPETALKRMVIMEAEVMKELGKGGKSDPPAERNERGQFVKGEKPEAPEKKISDAPPPPVEVNARGSQPADEVERSVRDNDFRSFKKAADARELAARRR